MPELTGRPRGEGRRIAVVVARFNELITGRLLAGAREALESHGVRGDAVTTVHVPGAFELPLASRWLLDTGRYHAVVALGAVIRGETDHYDHVCDQAAAGLLRAGLDSGAPVAFGVLTCGSREQALERAGGAKGNKGADAVLAALEMADLRDRLAEG